MRVFSSLKQWCIGSAFLGLAFFYFSNLPQYVQGGDSGEMVLAAYRLLVAHPPGYPLWIWLEHFFTHLIPLGSVFWRASLLSSLFSLSALLCIFSSTNRSPWSVLSVCILALATPFIEAALIPDVFSFHALLIVVIGSVYLFSVKDSRLFHFGIPFLFSLSLAHHLTTVFLFPVVCDVAIECRKEKKIFFSFLLSAFVGVCFALGLYWSMVAFHPNSSLSWGIVDSPAAILRHFLRSDYGTFRLSARENTGTLAGVIFFLRSSWIEICAFAALFLTAFLTNPKALRDKKILVWGGGCIASIGFFLMANVNPVGMGEEVLRRFCLMPLVQLTLLAAYSLRFVSTLSRMQRALVLTVGMVVCFQIWRAAEFKDLDRDSIFEDYALNLLTQAERHKPVVVFTESDNAYFAMRYVQAIFGVGRGVAVAVPSLFFHPWYLEKIRSAAPGFELPRAEMISKTRQLDLESDLLTPNQKKFSLIFTRGYQNGKFHHVKFLGLGRIVGEGVGVDFDEDSLQSLVLRTNVSERPSGPQSFSKGFLYAEYSYFYLAKALLYHSSGQKEAALENWKTALRRVPYAFPALMNFCLVKGNADLLCSPVNLERTRKQAEGLF